MGGYISFIVLGGSADCGWGGGGERGGGFYIYIYVCSCGCVISCCIKKVNCYLILEFVQ